MLEGGRCDGVDLAALAVAVPTPCYVYSASRLRAGARRLLAALAGCNAQVCYAVKANPNLAILRLLGEAGCGADIVSAGELQRALGAGIPADRIVFSGVGKTAAEIDAALGAGILRFNVESAEELALLDARARALGRIAAAALRINPDIDAGTHGKISTGKACNKFGIDLPEARALFGAVRAGRHPGLRLDGLHVHIGSQILDLAPLGAAAAALMALRAELEAAGSPIRSLDLGGGLGVGYRHAGPRPPEVEDYVRVLRAALRGYDGVLLLEPGRHLVAEAGLLLTRVIRVKRAADREFLVVDAAMNDLLRPSLYEAWHEILRVDGRRAVETRYDVVGPVCETGDTFAEGRPMPVCAAGDLLAIADAGAYGASMSSSYNSRPLAAEVLLERGRWALVRRAQTFAEMVALESASPAHWQQTDRPVRAVEG